MQGLFFEDLSLGRSAELIGVMSAGDIDARATLCQVNAKTVVEGEAVVLVPRRDA